MDSWIYPAFDRLAGLGAINKQFAAMRPWTRLQCAELVLEARENLFAADAEDGEATRIADALAQEFAPEIQKIDGASFSQADVESVYTRPMGISGTPLRDGYHFGQTITDDYGRPYNTGFNNVSGISGQVVSGRFFAYVRGEYQSAPAYEGLNSTQLSFLEQVDGTPSEPYLQAHGAVNQFDLLDAYAGVRLGVFDVTFGKQTLWWGAGTLGPMLMSDNADPILMLKINQVDPIVLPGILKRLGPVRVQAFMGRLSGNQFPRGPYLHGERISLKPSPNLEIGITRTTQAFGQGIPLTLRNLFSTYFSTSDICCTANPQNFPGKRQGGVDAAYRLPFLRRWVTVYTDDFSEDDVSPLVDPSRGMEHIGIYLPQIPRVPRLDFRVEAANTRNHEEAYASFFYRNAYTNKGFLIGDAVGRHGSMVDASSTYWFSPRKRVEVGWDNHTVGKEFLTYRGSQNSVRVQADWFIQRDLEVSVFTQRELWSFPFLAPTKHADNVFSIQFMLYPRKLSARTALRNSF